MFSSYIANETQPVESVERKQTIIDAEMAFQLGGAQLWNKLYKKDLFDDIRFPEGRIYEDLAIILDVLNKAKK